MPKFFSQLELKPPPSKTPTTSDWEIEEQNHNCLHRNKYSRLERLQFYPFNKASYIKIVSFNGARIDSSQTPPHARRVCQEKMTPFVIKQFMSLPT